MCMWPERLFAVQTPGMSSDSDAELAKAKQAIQDAERQVLKSAPEPPPKDLQKPANVHPRIAQPSGKLVIFTISTCLMAICNSSA